MFCDRQREGERYRVSHLRRDIAAFVYFERYETDPFFLRHGGTLADKVSRCE